MLYVHVSDNGNAQIGDRLAGFWLSALFFVAMKQTAIGLAKKTQHFGLFRPKTGNYTLTLGTTPC